MRDPDWLYKYPKNLDEVYATYKATVPVDKQSPANLATWLRAVENIEDVYDLNNNDRTRKGGKPLTKREFEEWSAGGDEVLDDMLLNMYGDCSANSKRLFQEAMATGDVIGFRE